MPGKKRKPETQTENLPIKKNHMGIDPASIKLSLEQYSRDPFKDILRQALANTPSDQAISSMSEADPLRWADYTTKIAKLYGYSESQSMTVTHRVIHEMTTLEIQAELASLEQKALKQIDINSSDIKDVTPVEKA